MAQKLACYVENGGNLISEACPGRINEHAYAKRGELSPALCELFGVRQASLTMVREPEGGMRWSPHERTWGEYLEPSTLQGTGLFAGHQVRANLYIETFQCVGSEPFLFYGEDVAGVVRQAGAAGGQAWLIGTFIGYNGVAYRNSETQAFVRALMEQCGVSSAHPGYLLLRKRAIPGKEAWLFTNPTEYDLTEDVDVGGWTHVYDLLGIPLDREGDRVFLTVASLDVRVLILSKE